MKILIFIKKIQKNELRQTDGRREKGDGEVGGGEGESESQCNKSEKGSILDRSHVFDFFFSKIIKNERKKGAKYLVR